jgi:hypothetical protein
MKSSLHRLIHFFPLFCNCQFRRLDSIQFLCSQVHIPAGWRLETRLTLLNWTLLYNYSAGTTLKTQPLYCREGMFTASLHSNGSYSIIAWVYAAAGTCLPILTSLFQLLNVMSKYIHAEDIRYIYISYIYISYIYYIYIILYIYKIYFDLELRNEIS